MSDSTIARPTSRPTPLYFSPRRLVEFACFYAAEVAQGAYPYVDFDPDERWHQRLYRDPRIDVWLISWLPSQGTELHDHGGSSGAFTVLRGTLDRGVVDAAAHAARAGADGGCAGRVPGQLRARRPQPR